MCFHTQLFPGDSSFKKGALFKERSFSDESLLVGKDSLSNDKDLLLSSDEKNSLFEIKFDPSPSDRCDSSKYKSSSEKFFKRTFCKVD
ncbi:23982_t:CDS:2 [Gigaspora rosea]|nr:23982_t:CDS:2 [Gigaspora rosea]